MARGKATGITHAKTANSKLTPPARPRKKPIRKKRTLKKNESQLSYKDSHSIGRRKSTNVPTYNESGRLYYDLYVKFGPSDSFATKEEKVPKESNNYGGFESDISDTTTVACNDNSGPSTANRKISAKRRKRRTVKKRVTLAEPQFSNSRREASLNAEAKVNMLFESTKESKYRRRSSPALPSTSVKGEATESGDKSSETPTSKKRISRAKRTRVSEPLPILSPPQKRLAGLNAMAIISACIKSPTSYSGTKSRVRRGRPKSSTPLSTEVVKTLTNAVAQSSPIKSYPSPTTQTQALSTSNAATTMANVSTDAKVVPTSVVPTVERFQSRKVISYGPKCIGVENISRQIIHVPSQAQCVPGPSCSTPMQQQCIFSPPGVFPPIPVSSPHTVSSPQNHSMIVLPDSSFSSPTPIVPTDIHPCFTTNQFYLSPFSGHSPALQPHQTFYMSSPTVFHSMPSSSPFQFLSTTPFAYMQSSTVMPTTHTTNYMLPMPLTSVYNTFSSGGFGGCIVPRPMFTAPLPIPHLQPQPQTSLVAEVGSPPVVHQPPQRIDRAVSPMPESGIPTSAPTTINVTSTPIKRASTNKKAMMVEKTPAPCLWVWVGEPSEKRVFLKVSYLIA